MKIESNTVEVNASQEVVHSFLSDSTNLLALLPEENISDWKATSSECSFKVQGGVVITLVQNGSENKQKVFMKSGEKAPFPYKLTLHINALDSGKSSGYIEFEADINVFMKMMVEKPLTGLFNHMASRLQAQFA